MTNDTQTMTLAEFLLARVAEDEARGRTVEGDRLARVAAECEAKRRIVEASVEARRASDAWTAERLATDTRSPLPEMARSDAYAEVLRALALPYADHPDYRDEWAV